MLDGLHQNGYYPVPNAGRLQGTPLVVQGVMSVPARRGDLGRRGHSAQREATWLTDSCDPETKTVYWTTEEITHFGGWRNYVSR
jgi:hypothetical protein